MVEEVLVLREDVECPWLRIIGAKNPVDGSVSGKRLHDLLERIRANADIGIQEEEILSPRDLGAPIAGRTWSARPFEPEDTDSQLGSHVRGAVVGAIIDNDYFTILER